MADTFPPSIARPESVSNAVRLMYASFGVGILRSALEFQSLNETVPTGFIFGIWIAVSAIMLFLIYSISRGRNWARITFLVLFAIGLPFAVQPLLQSLSTQLVSGILGIAQMVAQITALVLLFQASANVWFRGAKKSGKQTDSVEF
jgi:hypothetical protein